MTIKNYFLPSGVSTLITLVLLYWWTQQKPIIGDENSVDPTAWIPEWVRALGGNVGQTSAFHLNSFANSQRYAVLARSSPLTEGVCGVRECKILVADRNVGIHNPVSSFQLIQTSYDSPTSNQPTQQCVENCYAVPVKRRNEILPGRFTLIPDTNSNGILNGQQLSLTVLASSQNLDQNQNYKWVIIVISQQGQAPGGTNMAEQPQVNPNFMVLSLVDADIDWVSLYAALEQLSKQYPHLRMQLKNLETCYPYRSVDLSQSSRAVGYLQVLFGSTRPGPVSPTTPSSGTSTYTCCHFQSGSVWTTGATGGKGCPSACGKNTTFNTYSCCAGICTCPTCNTCKLSKTIYELQNKKFFGFGSKKEKFASF